MHCTAEVDEVCIYARKCYNAVFVNIIKVASRFCSSSSAYSGGTFSPDSSFYLLMFLFSVLCSHLRGYNE